MPTTKPTSASRSSRVRRAEDELAVGGASLAAAGGPRRCRRRRPCRPGRGSRSAGASSSGVSGGGVRAGTSGRRWSRGARRRRSRRSRRPVNGRCSSTSARGTQVRRHAARWARVGEPAGEPARTAAHAGGPAASRASRRGRVAVHRRRRSTAATSRTRRRRPPRAGAAAPAVRKDAVRQVRGAERVVGQVEPAAGGHAARVRGPAQDQAYRPSSTARPPSPSSSGRKVSTMTASSSKYSAPREPSTAPGCGPWVWPPGCRRDRADADPGALAGLVVAVDVEHDLVGVDVGVVVGHRDRQRVVVDLARHEVADHEVRCPRRPGAPAAAGAPGR